jgi:F-type H+-transporting ATPase subunit delta
VFRADRWAAAFSGSLGKDAGAGFECLKALTLRLQPVSGILFGRSAAKKLERELRESSAAFSVGPEFEYTIRFICLLVEKNLFRRIDAILAEIERWLDEQNGVLQATAESAFPIDSTFEDELGKLICERTGAARIKMRTRLIPELLAGYRLRIGGFCFDASLKGQLEKMAEDLTGGLEEPLYGAL